VVPYTVIKYILNIVEPATQEPRKKRKGVYLQISIQKKNDMLSSSLWNLHFDRAFTLNGIALRIRRHSDFCLPHFLWKPFRHHHPWRKPLSVSTRLTSSLSIYPISQSGCRQHFKVLFTEYSNFGIRIITTPPTDSHKLRFVENYRKVNITSNASFWSWTIYWITHQFITLIWRHIFRDIQNTNLRAETDSGIAH
jgi:hypothetical protein